MARREPSPEVDYLRDVVWDREVTLPQVEFEMRPAPRKVAPVLNDGTARLRKMIEFAQWQRVAMVRFGIASAAWAAAGCEAIALFAHRAHGQGGPEPDEMRRGWERAREIIRGNHEALEKALEDTGEALDLFHKDFF